MTTREPATKTIQRRLGVLFLAILAFVLFLAAASIYNTMMLKADLVAIEDFSTLSNNVLELRRYEKNLLFDVGAENYQQFTYYFALVQRDIRRLHPAIRAVAGDGRLETFLADLSRYGQLVDHGRATGSFDEAAIRQVGQNLVAFTEEILDRKKHQIHDNLQTATVVFIAVTAGGFLFLLIVLAVQARSILSRLALLRRATRDVVRGSFTPLPEEQGGKDEIAALIRAFNRMVAEIQSQQEQLLQAKKLAAIGTFASGIAHELNNPLNNISLTADTLHEEYDDLPPEEAKELISDILIQTERASTVVKNLLDFSRDTKSGEVLLDMKEVVGKTARLIRNQLRLQAIWVEDYIPEDLPPVKGDMQKLQQVFLNLFLNAIHAMPDGGLIHLEGRVDPPGYVCIEFNDTGCGIPPDKLEHIFDPFFTTKAVGQGTGLGLSIVYGIIQKMGGYIEVRSKVDVGTTFAIHLPIAQESEPHGDQGGGH